MTFDNSFILSRMADDARGQYTAAKNRIAKIDDLLDQQMGGKSLSRIRSGFAVTLFWLAAYGILCFVLDTMEVDPFPLIGMALSALLVVLMLLDQGTQIKYYGSISRIRSRLSHMHARIEADERDLSTDLRDFLASRSSGWQLALTPGESIPDALDDVEQQIGGIAALQTGPLQKAKLIFYHLTGLAWTAAGCFALEGLFYSFLGGDLSMETMHVIFLIGMLLTGGAQFLVARYLWTQTNCAVTNLTLFATLAGPVIFCLLTLLVGLVVAVITLILGLLAAALALLVGFSVLSAFCSGG